QDHGRFIDTLQSLYEDGWFDWLYLYAKEQSERVQELEEENKRIRQMKYYEAYEQGKFDTNMKVWYEIPKLEKQNKRYREALEFYADKDEYYAKINFFDDDKSRYGEVYLDE